MAIYHCSVKTVSRSSGRSAVAAAAYRSGEKLIDYTTGEVKDYARKQGVLSTGLVFPESFDPILIRDREQLWNMAEQAEKRKNSTVAREIEVALPAELDPNFRNFLVETYCKELAQKHGVAVDYAIHAPSRHGDDRNYHAHILMTTRRLTADGGLGAKTREWDDKKLGSETTLYWRKEWEKTTNAVLRICGKTEQIDCRSLKEQGITDREPSSHKGVARTAMERKGVELPSEPIAEPFFEPRFEERAEIQQAEREIAELQTQLAQVQKEQEEQSPERQLEKARQEIKAAEWELAKQPNNPERKERLQKAIEKERELTGYDEQEFRKNLATVAKYSPEIFVKKYEQSIDDLKDFDRNIYYPSRFKDFGNPTLLELGRKIEEYGNNIDKYEEEKQTVIKNRDKYIAGIKKEIDQLKKDKEQDFTDLKYHYDMHQTTRKTSFLGGLRTALRKEDGYQKQLVAEWEEKKNNYDKTAKSKIKLIENANNPDSDYSRDIAEIDKQINAQKQLKEQTEVKLMPYLKRELAEENLALTTFLLRCNLRKYVENHLIKNDDNENKLYHATRRLYNNVVDNMNTALDIAELKIKETQNSDIDERLKEFTPRFGLIKMLVDTNKKIKDIQRVNREFDAEYRKFDKLLAQLPESRQGQFNAQLDGVLRRTEKLDPVTEFKERFNALKQMNASMDRIINPPSRSQDRGYGMSL